MIKLLLVILVFTFSLTARENPFFSVDDESMPITSNIDMSLTPLKNASLTFPSTARTIESVTVKYKNLDGSEQTKSILLNNSIDWHLPLFFSQSYNEERTMPLQEKAQYKKVYSLKFLSIYQNGKNIKIVTQDKIIRNFLLVKPHRIVFDVQSDLDIKSHIKKLSKNPIFTKIRIGNHKGYYRVVLELDGYYTYTLKTLKNSYLFELR